MTDLESIQKTIDGITLPMMKTEVDLGDVVLQDGPKSAKLAALWLVQRYFWDHPSIRAGEGASKRALESSLKQAKYLATGYLINEWPSLGERALLCLLEDASQTGWHTGDLFNYKTISEMLASVLDEQESPVGISNWTFIVGELLPAAERMGIDPLLLYGASTQAKKLRELVPTARVILNSDMPDEEKQEHLERFIAGAANNLVKPDEYRRDAERYRGKRTRQVNKLLAHEIILPNGETWIIVRCNNEKDERVIEVQLGKKVDLQVTDWRNLTVELVSMLKDYPRLREDPDQLLQKLVALTGGGNEETRGELELELDA